MSRISSLSSREEIDLEALRDSRSRRWQRMLLACAVILGILDPQPPFHLLHFLNQL